MPKVSVIITTWNRSVFLKKAIQSVLVQTFPDFELLILDNSSTDETEAVIKGFKDRRIRHIRHAPLGISKSRNLGVREAKAEFVGFLDDDDEWLPEKLRKQMSLFSTSSESTGMIYCGFYRVRGNGEIYDTFTPTLRSWALTGYLCDRNPLTGSASNPLMRKKAMVVVGGYDEHLKTSEDWEFYLRLLREYQIDFVPEPLVKIRKHEGTRLGDRVLDAAAAEMKVCKEFESVLALYPKSWSSYLQAIGGKFCRGGNPEVGRRYLRDAIMKNPANGIAYAQYLLSFF